MVLIPHHQALIAALLVVFPTLAHSFGDTFVVNCMPLSIQRSDPIIQIGPNTGTPSGHVHSIVGGNNFSRNMTDKLAATNANATTCDKKLDNSNYWVPQLYYIREDNMFELVPFTGSAIYYQNRACNYTTASQYCDRDKVALAFPEGFRMIAGDANRRTQNISDVTNRAVNIMCMNDNSSKETYGFPTETCKTMRAQVYFPSCWNGVDLDSKDHKSHVAYPAVGDYNGGVCPSSHPIALLSIFFEFFFTTAAYSDPTRFVFANADRTGYGFHGDFIMGWTNITALQTAHQTCGPDYCPINIAGAEPGKNVQEPQILIHPAIYEEEIGLNGPVSKLPGNNPVSMLR